MQTKAKRGLKVGASHRGQQAAGCRHGKRRVALFFCYTCYLLQNISTYCNCCVISAQACDRSVTARPARCYTGPEVLPHTGRKNNNHNQKSKSYQFHRSFMDRGAKYPRGEALQRT